MTIWTRASILLVVGIAATPSLRAQAADTSNLTAAQIVEKSEAAYAAVTSYRDEGRLSAIAGSKVAVGSFTTRLTRPGLYRLDFNLGQLQVNVWSAGSGNSVRINDGNAPHQFASIQRALTAGDVVTFGVSVDVPGVFYNILWQDAPWPDPKRVQRKPDQTISGVDCFVLLQPGPTSTATFWIGKKDLFIRQIERDIDGPKTRAAAQAEVQQDPDLAPPAILNLVNNSPSFVQVESHFNIVVNEPIPDDEFMP